jgi:hypothetical protein
MPITGRAANIQATISSLLGVDGNGLVSVPTETLDQQRAVRVLQVQIFELADAVADLAQAVEELHRGRR